MFCPKCGTENPNTGKFCRNCGVDLGNVTEALSGKLTPPTQALIGRKGKPITWESAIVKLFTGLAFIGVTIALSGSQTGRDWWFWLLLPAFISLGSGIAQIVQLRKAEKGYLPSANFDSSFSTPNVKSLPEPSALQMAEIRDLLATNNKIEAIKVYREATGAGLKESKDAVELIERTPVSNYYQKPQGSIYDTGEFLAPPSVIEGTTRHLEVNKEGETMTLPKNDLG